MSFLAHLAQDHISVTDVDFGDDFPTVSKARVRPCGEAGRVVRLVLSPG